MMSDEGETLPTPETLCALYTRTCSEITRYRDLEWQNVTRFSAAIVAIIGFVLAQPDIVQSHKWLFDITLFLLAAGNIFYTSFAHDRLTLQRNVLAGLEKKMGLTGLKIDNVVPLPKVKCECGRRRGWRRGFWSHLLPFFAADVLLSLYGIWLVHR